MIPSYLKIKILVKCREYSTLGFKRLLSCFLNIFTCVPYAVFDTFFSSWALPSRLTWNRQLKRPAWPDYQNSTPSAAGGELLLLHNLLVTLFPFTQLTSFSFSHLHSLLVSFFSHLHNLLIYLLTFTHLTFYSLPIYTACSLLFSNLHSSLVTLFPFTQFTCFFFQFTQIPSFSFLIYTAHLLLFSLLHSLLVFFFSNLHSLLVTLFQFTEFLLFLFLHLHSSLVTLFPFTQLTCFSFPIYKDS